MTTNVSRIFGGLAAGLASGLLIAASGSVSAKTPDPDNATPAATQPAEAKPDQVDTKRYCVIDQVTGSRLPTKVCKTKAQWAAEGIDVTHR